MSLSVQYRAVICMGMAAMFAWGCSRSPVSAVQPQPPATPSFVHVPVGGAQAFSSNGATPGSSVIDGAAGGTVTNGRFTLVIPPGAFSGTATVTIVVPDPGVLLCQLQVSTPAAARFAIPATLISDFSGGAGISASDLGLLRFDEATQRWLVVHGSVVETSTSSLTTPLTEASDCGVAEGKAGW